MGLLSTRKSVVSTRKWRCFPHYRQISFQLSLSCDTYQRFPFVANFPLDSGRIIKVWAKTPGQLHAHTHAPHPGQTWGVLRKINYIVHTKPNMQIRRKFYFYFSLPGFEYNFYFVQITGSSFFSHSSRGWCDINILHRLTFVTWDRFFFVSLSPCHTLTSRRTLMFMITWKPCVFSPLFSTFFFVVGSLKNKRLWFRFTKSFACGICFRIWVFVFPVCTAKYVCYDTQTISVSINHS